MNNREMNRSSASRAIQPQFNGSMEAAPRVSRPSRSSWMALRSRPRLISHNWSGVVYSSHNR
jgi:hypothetical protein